ncbi:MAG: imidazolonepropionase [Alphaproteobacteria bacterium]
MSEFSHVFVNANLATMTGGSYGMAEDGALAVKDGRIAWIGKSSDAPKAETVTDVKAGWLTPGLIDCHTHLVYGGNRANEFAMRQNGKTYAEIAAEGGGINSTVLATRFTSEEKLYKQAARRLKAFLAEGVTTMEIKSGYGLDIENETKMLRVARRLGQDFPVTIRTTFLGAHALPPEFEGRKDDYIAHVAGDMLPAIAKEKLADAVDGFCEKIAFSPKQIETVFKAAQAHGLAIKLHAGQLSDQGGAQLAAEYSALSADHLEYVSEAGIRAMAEAGTVAVLLPGAFFMLKETKKPPVESLRKHGVPIALASDCNPGSSPVCSLLAMLSMGCIQFGLTPEEALLAVTTNAARALGLQDEIGTLEVGKKADIVWWDIEHPVELSYQLGGHTCLGVMKDGKM